MCHDINDRLQEVGQVTFAELTVQYDLPRDFLKKVARYLAAQLS